MRDYGKVHSTFWSSQTTASLSDDGKMLALYLMTCSHNTIAGVFRLPEGYVCEDLGWDGERVREGFNELFSKGFANRCGTTKWVWIVKHLEWNPPENPNQRKAASKVAESIPRECAWKRAFMRVWAAQLGINWEEEENPSGTVEEPFLNQKQKQEQKQEQEQNSEETSSLPGTAYRVPACPTPELVEKYHEHLPMLPRIVALSDSRKRAISARWREVCGSEKFDLTAGIEWFCWYFGHAAKSPFLTGKTKDWKADIDFLMNPSKFAKVVEGAYHQPAKENKFAGAI